MGIVVAVMQIFHAGVEAALAIGDGAFVAFDAAVLIAGPEALLPGKRQCAVADGNVVFRRNAEAVLLLGHPVNAGLGKLGVMVGVRSMVSKRAECFCVYERTYFCSRFWSL